MVGRGRRQQDLRQTLGAAAGLWASPLHHQVGESWWLACSGELNVNYNVAFSQSADPAVLTDRCIQPILDLGRPAIVMLAGPGLGTAQKLVEMGWVDVGALPLMVLTTPAGPGVDGSGVRALSAEDLPAARELLSDTYGLDNGSARAAVPDRALTDAGLAAWGLFDGEQLQSCFTGSVTDGLLVVWSMATRTNRQGRGYGRRLLRVVLDEQLGGDVTGSLLQSSVAGQRLYDSLGYDEVEHWQLWSRPRWVMANA
jgi:GNAT superfamily N-acetyltransferase